MLEMGVHPQVAAATSAVMIFFTSLTATTSFVVFGLVTWDYAAMMFILGGIMTAGGQVREILVCCGFTSHSQSNLV